MSPKTGLGYFVRLHQSTSGAGTLGKSTKLPCDTFAMNVFRHTDGASSRQLKRSKDVVCVCTDLPLPIFLWGNCTRVSSVPACRNVGKGSKRQAKPLRGQLPASQISIEGPIK